jgi:hypothetical protein
MEQNPHQYRYNPHIIGIIPGCFYADKAGKVSGNTSPKISPEW